MVCAATFPSLVPQVLKPTRTMNASESHTLPQNDQKQGHELHDGRWANWAL
jgi:hypothetical protein